MPISETIFMEQVKKLERRFDWNLPVGSKVVWIEEFEGEGISGKDFTEAVRRCLKDPNIRRFPTVNDLIKIASLVQCERYGQEEQKLKFEEKKRFSCGELPEACKRALEKAGVRDIDELARDMPGENQPTQNEVERKRDIEGQKKTILGTL